MRRTGWVVVGAVLVAGICITALSAALARELVSRPAPTGSVSPVVLTTTGPGSSPEPGPGATPAPTASPLPETTGPTAVPRDVEHSGPHNQHRRGQ